MKRLFLVVLFSAMALAVPADEDTSSAAKPAASEADEARRERYRRRHEMLMERAIKRGQVVPAVPVVPPPPGAPVPPPPPVVAVAPVSLYGNGTATSALAAEPVSVNVLSLAYDEAEKRGVLVVEVVGGSFTGVNRYIRDNIGKLARNDAPGEDAPKIPPDARLKIKSITIDEYNVCNIEFVMKN